MQYVITANYRNRSSSFPWLVREVGQRPSQAKAYKGVNATGVTFRSADGMGESSLGCTSVAVADAVETFDPEIPESPALPVEVPAAAPVAEEAPARIPFDKARAFAGEKVITRDGDEVTNIRANSHSVYTLQGTVSRRSLRVTWTDEGFVLGPRMEDGADLFMAEPAPTSEPAEPERIPFNKARALNGGNVITRDGRTVSGLTDDESGDMYPLNGRIDGAYESWTDEGVTYTDEESDEDLFMADRDSGKVEEVKAEAAPEPVKTEEPVRHPFNMERALDGAKVITRDGREVTGFRRTNSFFAYPLIGSLAGYGTETWNTKGQTYENDAHEHDLFMAEPDPVVKEPKAETVAEAVSTPTPEPEPTKTQIHFNGSFYHRVPNGRGGERNEYLNGVKSLELKPDKTMFAVLLG